MMLVTDCEMIELVVFHPLDWIYNSICSWILTTTIDFDPYKDVLFGVHQYALKVKQSFIRYTESFQNENLRYSLLLNMTMHDINLVVCEITLTQIEILNVIDNIHRPKDLWMKRSLLPFGRLLNFLFGTARMMLDQ